MNEQPASEGKSDRFRKTFSSCSSAHMFARDCDMNSFIREKFGLLRTGERPSASRLFLNGVTNTLSGDS